MHGEEFVELQLSDTEDGECPRIWVTETLYEWDEANDRIMKDSPQHRTFTNLAEAQAWYSDRRQALSDKGFSYSDLDW
jgi:hypothetical protein